MHQPYGLEGGGPGERGKNLWIKQPRKEDGDLYEGSTPLKPRVINVGGKATVMMGKRDRMVIHTPGGGAWGALDGDKQQPIVEGKGGEWKAGWAARGSLAEREALQAGF